MKSIEEIREAFGWLHGEVGELRPEHPAFEADTVINEAIDELERLRRQNAEFVEIFKRMQARSIDKTVLLATLSYAQEWMKQERLI